MPTSVNEELRQLARQRLVPYLKVLYGDDYIVNRFHNYLAGVFEKAIVRTPGYTRINISVPPQHGKSFLASQGFPAWAFGHSHINGIRSREHITEVSYSATLAAAFGSEVRYQLTREKYSGIFPENHLHGTDGKSGSNISLPNRSTYRAIGFDGSITGFPSSILITDDVTKNRQQDESPTIKAKLHSAFGPNVYTRLQSDAIFMNIQTRWSETDLAGFLMDRYSGDNWLYIRLPAICDSEDDLLGRAIGEPLAPHRFSLEDLLRIRKNQSTRDWAALYQQDPIVGAGSFWKPEYLLIGTEPSAAEFSFIFASWDCASELHTDADYTACTLWGIYVPPIGQPQLWNLGAWRWKVEFPGLCEVFDLINDTFSPAFHIVEKASNGIALAQYMAKNQPDIKIEVESAHRNKGIEFGFASKALKDKMVRWADVQHSDIDTRNIAINELSTWPGGKNDDLAISSLLAIRWLQKNFNHLTMYTRLQAKADDTTKRAKLLRKRRVKRYGSVY